MRWLVIDDSELSGCMAVEILKSLSQEAEWFASGDEALSYLGDNPNEKAGAVLLDYRMPGLDGPAVAEKIRTAEENSRKNGITSNDDELKGCNEENRHIFIVGMSGDTDEETVSRQKKAGMDEIIAKPLESCTIKAIIGHCNSNSYAGSQVSSPGKIHENSCTNVFGGTDLDDSKTQQQNIKWNYVLFDKNIGVKYSGSEKLFLKYIDNFDKSYKKQKEIITGYFESGDINNFTIAVHALKSTARMLGNMSLSEMAANLEKLGDAGKCDKIAELMPEFLKAFAAADDEAKKIVSDFNQNRDDKRNTGKDGSEKNNTDGNISNENISNEDISESQIKNILEILDALSEAAESFDIDFADRCIDDIEKIGIPKSATDEFGELERCAAEVDFAGLSSEILVIKALISNI